MPNAASLNPILLLLSAPSGPSKGASTVATQGQLPGLFQEGEFAGLLGLLNESGGSGRMPKDQSDLPNQKKPDVSGEALLVGLIGQVLLQKKDSFLNGQLGPQAKDAYRTLLESYIGMVSRSKGEQGEGIRHYGGGKAAGKMPSLNRMLPATGLLEVAPESHGDLLSDVKDLLRPTPLGTQKAKSPASFQEKNSAASILSKTPLEPLHMNGLSRANAQTDRLLELLSALVQPQAQAKEGQRSAITPPLLQASGQADQRNGKGRVQMFAGPLDELSGSKSSVEKLQGIVESRFSEHRAWLNLKETPEFASKIQAENNGGAAKKRCRYCSPRTSKTPISPFKKPWLRAALSDRTRSKLKR